jgi:hypothetical protein
VRSARLTKLAFNPKHPILLVGDSKGNVSCLKLSPNLRRNSGTAAAAAAPGGGPAGGAAAAAAQGGRLGRSSSSMPAAAAAAAAGAAAAVSESAAAAAARGKFEAAEQQRLEAVIEVAMKGRAASGGSAA